MGHGYKGEWWCPVLTITGPGGGYLKEGNSQQRTGDITVREKLKSGLIKQPS